MHSFFAFTLATAIVSLSNVQAIPYPFNSARDDFTPLKYREIDVINQLGPQLSKNATIFTQNDPRFANATARWSAYKEPQISVVVEPGTEADVSAIVKYANAYHVPFLTVNRGHGSTETLGALKGGIEIHIRVLNDISISEDGASALLQGGVYDDQVISTLWDAGYVTNTGSCGCVGLMGPGLGGGYGRYMGFYGLVADNFISLNVVLADGSAITVSETSYPDLWWAMRGAGHNFGIVTSLNQKIYKRTVDAWFYATYTFTQDKLEDLFEAVNHMTNNGTQPKELMHYMLFGWVPEIDTTEPVIVITIYYVGTADQATQYLDPYNALGPVSVQNDSIPYPEIAEATGTGSGDPLCQFGNSHVQFPMGLLTYNITASRRIYNFFKNVTTETPAFNQSFIVFEGYSLEGMKAVDPASTAFPHRADNLLVDPTIAYLPNASLDDAAIAWGRQVAQMFHEGDEPGRERHTYVNYAFGDEPIESIYGYEPWRLQRLSALKKKYDPKNAFGYYNPIPF